MTQEPYATFGGMVWPQPSNHLDAIEYRMRHAHASVSESDMMYAASVLSAYRELIRCTVNKRAKVVRGIRAAADTGRKPD